MNISMYFVSIHLPVFISSLPLHLWLSILITITPFFYHLTPFLLELHSLLVSFKTWLQILEAFKSIHNLSPPNLPNLFHIAAPSHCLRSSWPSTSMCLWCFHTIGSGLPYWHPNHTFLSCPEMKTQNVR